jgi:hypothetical protein
MTTQRPLIQIYDTEAGQVTVREMDDIEYSTWLLEQDAQQASSVRAERNTLLAACDWTQVADAPVDKAAWASYRQALRDVPSQPGFPYNVIWPEVP